MRVTDDESNCHGLAERTTQAKENSPDHGRARMRQYDVPHDLPSSCTDGIRGLFQKFRRGLKYIAHNGGNERNNHDAEDYSRREHTDADRRPLKQGADNQPTAYMVLQPWFDMFGQHWRKYEQSPHAIDNAGDRRQQLDGGADRAFKPGRGKFRDE